MTDNKLYDNDLCPGACDFDAQGEAEPHLVKECGGPWKRQDDLVPGPRPLPKLCSPIHRCFPPQPTVCLVCHQTDPALCPRTMFNDEASD